MKEVLIIDDDKNLGVSLKKILSKTGLSVEHAISGEKARECLDKYSFMVLILDIKLPDANGLELLSELKKKFPNIEIIMVTAYASLDKTITAINEDAFGFVEKPFEMPYLESLVRDAMTKHKMKLILIESEKKFREAFKRAEFYKDLCSHDINNILQIILSGIQLCEMELDDPDEIKSIIQIVKDQVYRGAKLISNIRKLSLIDETKISLKRTEICDILKISVDYIKKSYKDKKIKIKVDSVSEQLYVQANELIRDVFENILINAVKHNKSAILEIEVMISKEQKLGVNYLKIEFQDNGVGISDLRKEKIFQRGYGKHKDTYGMGLGLSLVKKIIENYNGEIWVEDKVNGDYPKGSNFILIIPEVS